MNCCERFPSVHPVSESKVPVSLQVVLSSLELFIKSVCSSRLDLLPFYSRLVATLHPCMCDVAEDLCSMLKGDFRFHVGRTFC